MRKSELPSKSIKLACEEVKEAFELFICDTDSTKKEPIEIANSTNPTMIEIKKTLSQIKGQLDDLS